MQHAQGQAEQFQIFTLDCVDGLLSLSFTDHYRRLNNVQHGRPLNKALMFKTELQ